MTSTEQSGRFVFINAPALVSAGTPEQRRQVRSQLMRRLYQERQRPKGQQSSEPAHTDTSHDGAEESSPAICRCGAYRRLPSSTGVSQKESVSTNLATRTRKQLPDPEAPLPRSDNSDATAASVRLPLRFSRIRIKTGDGSICSQCGGKIPVEESRRRTKSHKRSDPSASSKAKLAATATKEFNGSLTAMRLGSSKIDPFGGQGNNRNEFGYHELIDHLLSRMIPSMRRADNWPLQVFGTYFQSPLTPLILHSFLLSISVHLERTARNNGAIYYPSRSLEQLHHKGLALKTLQSAISKPVIGNTVLDMIVLSITLLALHDEAPHSVDKDHNPFNPPFRDLQALNFYGFNSFHPVHWKAVQDLIVQNGGIHTIKLFGAPWVLSYSALKYATLMSTKPVLPIVDPEGNSYGDLPPLKILGISAEPSHKTCSGGFRQLQTLNVKSTIIRTFLDLCEYAQATRIFLKDSKQSDGSAMDRFGDTRNVVQHRMLCLPNPDEPLESIFTNTKDCNNNDNDNNNNPGEAVAAALDIYRVCWLAAKIFTLHVTFPLPCSRQIREGQLPLLQDAISRCYLHKQSNNTNSNGAEISEILLWCTTVGGIAEEDGDPARRSWYAFQLRRLCLTLNIHSWARMQELLCSFAWVDVGCDAAGYKLWMEAQHVEDYYYPDKPHVEEVV